MSYIEEYNQLVQSGEAIVGRWVKLQMGRLMADLADPDVRMDYGDSDKRIRFIETKLRHAQAPFAGKPFHLELFQKVIVEALFAPHIYDDELGRWVRKYQEVLLILARKNGKSPFVAAVSLAEWFCGRKGGNILYGSNDYEQADILFQLTNDMREESPSLSRCTRKNQKGIFFGNPRQHTKVGKFSYQNKGSIKKISARKQNKEGKNISLGAVDEVHEMADNSLIMPIRQALSTQDEPLYFEITTEGFVDDGNLDERRREAQDVLQGHTDNPRWLIFIYAQDTEEEVWQDEQSWYKSNPGIGTIKKWSFVRQMVEESRTNRKTKSFVLAKDFNIKQSTAEAWLEESVIDSTAAFEPAEVRGMYYIGGLDFAETTDLCSAKAMFVDPETLQKKTMSMYFIPETKADAMLEEANTANPEKKDYRAWARKGLVTICPGPDVDEAMVVDWYWSLYTDLRAIPFKQGYDNWHSKGFKKLFADKFGEELLERIGMDFMSLSGPMSSLESDLRYKKLNYNCNEMDRWCFRNTSLKLNNIGLQMPVKTYGQAKNRIDGTLGHIICYATFNRYKSEYLAIQRVAMANQRR